MVLKPSWCGPVLTYEGSGFFKYGLHSIWIMKVRKNYMQVYKDLHKLRSLASLQTIFNPYFFESSKNNQDPKI